MEPLGLPIRLSKNTPPFEGAEDPGRGPNESGEGDPYTRVYQVPASRFVFAGRQQSSDPGSPGGRKISLVSWIETPNAWVFSSPSFILKFPYPSKRGTSLSLLIFFVLCSTDGLLRGG